MIIFLFLAVLALLVVALFLVLPSNAIITFLIIAAIGVLGVIAYMLYRSLTDVHVWINGKPMGPGQRTMGVHRWIHERSFQQGTGTGGNPDTSKPVEPPPPDF